MAGTNRIKCYARAIKDGGIDCEVVVFGLTEKEGRKIKNTESRGVYEGVPFLYAGGATTGPISSIAFKIKQFQSQIQGEKYIRQNVKKGDVMFFYWGGDYRHMLRIMKIAKAIGAHCIQDLCELPYFQEDLDIKHIRNRFRFTEKYFATMNGVISISDALVDYAMANTLSSCKHIKIPIMVEYDKYVMGRSLGDIKEPFIFHAGTLIQRKDGILGMIEAFGKAKQQLQKSIKYILTGTIENSSHPKEIRKIIAKYQLQDSIEFVGLLNRDQVKDYLSRASLVISNRPKTKQDYYGFSTKVGEYLASGVPLIITRWGEAAKWLVDGESAYIVEPENTIELANTIVRVFNNPDEARRIGQNGQALCHKSFDYLNWSKPLVDFINTIG